VPVVWTDSLVHSTCQIKPLVQFAPALHQKETAMGHGTGSKIFYRGLPKGLLFFFYIYFLIFKKNIYILFLCVRIAF
jgi:hypothetical protein